MNKQQLDAWRDRILKTGNLPTQYQEILSHTKSVMRYNGSFIVAIIPWLKKAKYITDDEIWPRTKRENTTHK